MNITDNVMHSIPPSLEFLLVHAFRKFAEENVYYPRTMLLYNGIVI